MQIFFDSISRASTLEWIPILIRSWLWHCGCLWRRSGHGKKLHKQPLVARQQQAKLSLLKVQHNRPLNWLHEESIDAIRKAVGHIRTLGGEE